VKSGRDPLVLRTRIRGDDLHSMDDLEEILDRFVVYGETTTSIIHSAPVANRPLPLVENEDSD
jgi:hypothetical protein